MKVDDIPEKRMVSPEITLIERLVWVSYKDQWWPALLYETYTELQAQLYDELDMVLKAQFAVAIMRQMNENKDIKVARLLGREILEIVEVNDNQHAEFYRQLPKVLPMACQKSLYGNDTELYLDFHRALDEVEEIIHHIPRGSFNNLSQSEEKKTWLQRAQEALKSSEVPKSGQFISKSQLQSQSRPEEPSPSNSMLQSNSLLQPNNSILQGTTVSDNKVDVKAVVDQENSNFLFNALDGMMEKLNSTYECASGDVLARDIAFVNNTPAAKPPADIINVTGIDENYSEALLKQKEYRSTLRDIISKQRDVRESESSGNINNISTDNDEARNTYFNDNTGMWKLLNSKDESEERAFPTFPTQSVDSIQQSRSYSAQRDYISSVPELRVVLPRNKTIKNSVGQIPIPPKAIVTEHREPEYPDDDREAIKAAARAAAAVELDMTFWDHMTCHTLENS